MRALLLAAAVGLLAITAPVLAPAAAADACVGPSGVTPCPPGSVPWPTRPSSSCGQHGAGFPCAWLG